MNLTKFLLMIFKSALRPAKFKLQVMNDIKIDKTEEFDGDKILVSFYLSPVTLEKIDDLLFYVKKRLPIARRRSLTKSVFYETGFKILIEEYEAEGEESSLLKAIQELMRKDA